jgi:transcription elongation factor Elf1
MGNCPFCGSSLEALIAEETVREKYRFNLEVYNPIPDYGLIGSESEVLKQEFKCPNCNRVITNNEDDARKLLSSPPRP